MSYILDALRRAENERRRQNHSPVEQVAAAQGPHEPQPGSPRRPGLILIILTVGILIAITAGLWLYLAHKKVTPAKRPSSVTAHAVPRPVPPQAHLAPSDKPSIAPVKPAIISGPDRIKRLSDLTAPPSPPTRSTATGSHASKPTAAPTNTQAASHQAVTDTASQPSQNSTQPTTVTPGNQTSATAASPAPTSKPAVPTSLPQMSEDYRSHFPLFTVEVHVYDSTPGKSWVMIDGRQYQDGDTLPNGLHIYRIVSDGIVFDWKGKRVLYPLNQ